MATKFFGQFLLEKGAITRDALLQAVNCQAGIRQPLCTLAIEEGCLSKAQLQKLDEEHRQSTREFIEIAMKTGVLSFDQVETLSEKKSEKWMFLGEALVRTNALDLVRLDELLREYRKGQPPAEAPSAAPLDSLPEKELVSSFVSTTVELFLHYTKETVEVLSAGQANIKPDDITYMFAQKVTGEKTFCFALALPEDLTLVIGSQMLQEKTTEINPLLLDAVAEFVNVVIGHGCTKLNIKNIQVSAEPPQIMMKEMLKAAVPRDVVNVRMKTGKGEFNVLFFFPGDDGKLPDRLI